MEDRNAAKARYTIALIATSRMFKEGTIDADEKVRVPGAFAALSDCVGCVACCGCESCGSFAWACCR